MGDRAGTVPADRRSLARVLHHRPSKWRAVHDLSGDLRAADEPRSAWRMDFTVTARRDGDDDAAVHHARIYLRRDRHDDARGPGPPARPGRSWASRRGRYSGH